MDFKKIIFIIVIIAFICFGIVALIVAPIFWYNYWSSWVWTKWYERPLIIGLFVAGFILLVVGIVLFFSYNRWKSSRNQTYMQSDDGLLGKNPPNYGYYNALY